MEPEPKKDYKPCIYCSNGEKHRYADCPTLRILRDKNSNKISAQVADADHDTDDQEAESSFIGAMNVVIPENMQPGHVYRIKLPDTGKVTAPTTGKPIIMDSACTDHISNDKEDFIDVSPSDKHIHLADNSQTTTGGVGSVPLSTLATCGLRP